MKKKVGILLKSILLLCCCMLFFVLSSCQNEDNPESIYEDNKTYDFEANTVYVYSLYDDCSTSRYSYKMAEYKNAYVDQYNTYFTVVVKVNATARQEYQFSNSAFGYRTSAIVNNYENRVN